MTTPFVREQQPGGMNSDSLEMTLCEFAREYHDRLPQQVLVTHGVYWKENLEVNISSSERLNIHFIRHRESVKIRDLGSEVEYSIPVTSTLEFGPVYNPHHGDMRDAMRGFIYPSVADILHIVETAPLPKLISATTDSSTTAPGDRVSKGELLLIKKVQSKTNVGYQQLQVQSLTTNTAKFLHEKCDGNFTTKPEAIKLSLFSIIKHIPNALPLPAMIFPGPTLDLGDEHYPTHLFQKVTMLCRTFTDVLLVASSVSSDSVCDDREPFEIPQEVELELKIMELKESDYQRLRDKSQQIMRRIQGDYLQQYRNAHQDQANYVVQEMFLKAVGTGEEDAVPRPRVRDPSQEHNYPNVKPLQEGLLSRLSKVEDMVWKMKKSQTVKRSSRGESIQHEYQNVSEANQQNEHEAVDKPSEALRALESQVGELKLVCELQQKQFQEELQHMLTELVALRGEVEEGRKENPGHQQQDTTSLHQKELLASPETAERNRALVAALSVDQVVQLVAELGVEDLQQIMEERVSGDILVELNEEELESELGIRKRIHRIKLMKVINGSKPVTQYIKLQECMDTLC
jgi:hypothetical protein